MSADATTERAALEAALAGREGWELFPCDPALADTAAFCEAYGFAPEDSANTIVVVGKSEKLTGTRPSGSMWMRLPAGAPTGFCSKLQ